MWRSTTPTEGCHSSGAGGLLSPKKEGLNNFAEGRKFLEKVTLGDFFQRTRNESSQKQSSVSGSHPGKLGSKSFLGIRGA